MYYKFPLHKFNFNYEDLQKNKDFYSKPKILIDKSFEQMDTTCIYLEMNIKQIQELYDKMRKFSYYTYENDILRYHSRFNINFTFDKYKKLTNIKYKYNWNFKTTEISWSSLKNS